MSRDIDGSRDTSTRILEKMLSHMVPRTKRN